MARSHETLWVSASATFAAVAIGLFSADVAFAAARQHYHFWSSGIMIGTVAAVALAALCYVGAMREWAMPLAGERPHRRAAAIAAQPDPAPAGPVADLTLTPRQVADKLLLDVRNNGADASFTAEVIFILRGEEGNTPEPVSGWAVPWAPTDGVSGPSARPAAIPHGQQRTLDLACNDPAAIRASRSGEVSGPHWVFSSLPDPAGVVYWPPIQSGSDLSARRFVIVVRIHPSSSQRWSDHTFSVGLSGSAIVCEPPLLAVEIVDTDWRLRELRDYVVAAQVQVRNNSGKNIRLSPIHWMQAAAPGMIPPVPDELPKIKAAVRAEQARRVPSLYDRMEIADGETVRGWIVYGVGRSKTGGKPPAFLVIRDEEGSMYPAAVSTSTTRR